ncbi:hypothetical protein LCGC14_1319840 [marine sediment metagenome]|uniref:Uncharacterized protein n=1 Tax=marine sediment metagenome TaxID=412755 RepID=A0A0F9NM77_9ZZZZ
MTSPDQIGLTIVNIIALGTILLWGAYQWGKLGQ